MTLVDTQQAANMRSGIEIAGHITGVSAPRTVNLKTGGTIETADATLSDDAGSITLQLWGEDINLVKEGSKVIVKNGYTNTFKGQVSLSKGKYGQIEVVE